MVAQRCKPEENPAPSARPSVCSGFTIYMLTARANPEGRSFLPIRDNVLFDSCGRKIEAFNCVVIHVRTSTTLFSLGLFGADRRTGALCATASGQLLAVHHFLRRIPGTQRIHRGGGAAGRGTPARRIPGIRAQIAHTGSGNTNHRQSCRWELRGTGRALPGTEAVREGARRL